MNILLTIALAASSWGAATDDLADGDSSGGLLLADPALVLEAAESGESVRPARRKPQSNPYGQEEPKPLNPTTGRPVRPTPSDTWLYFALSPFRGARNQTWHALFLTPALEEALALPVNTYHVHVSIDLATADWTSEAEGGSSRWKAAYLTETFEYNYAPMAGFLIGVRLTAGELGERNSQRVSVFEEGEQLVPDGDRGMNLQSIVARAKYVHTAGFLDLGGVVELKIPTAGREDFLTARTVDLALSGILSKRWGTFALHVNAGVVVPIGNADILASHNAVQPFPHAGIAAAWMPIESAAVFAQVEYTGSGFRDVTLWKNPSIVGLIGGRIKISGTAFLAAAVGSGLTRESGSLLYSGGIDLTF